MCFTCVSYVFHMCYTREPTYFTYKHILLTYLPHLADNSSQRATCFPRISHITRKWIYTYNKNTQLNHAWHKIPTCNALTSTSIPQIKNYLWIHVEKRGNVQEKCIVFDVHCTYVHITSTNQELTCGYTWKNVEMFNKMLTVKSCATHISHINSIHQELHVDTRRKT